MAANPSGPVVRAPGAPIAACPHTGQMVGVVPQTNVLASGRALVTPPVPVTIAGCPFTLPSTEPSPCTFVAGVQASSRVLVNGKPALLASRPPMLCSAADQAPQGPPLGLTIATKVLAT